VRGKDEEGAHVDFVIVSYGYLAKSSTCLKPSIWSSSTTLVLGDRSLWEAGARSVSCLSKGWCGNILFMTKNRYICWSGLWTLVGKK